MGSKEQASYPSDVSDEEWAFVLPYLLFCRADSPQRRHDLRAVFNPVRSTSTVAHCNRRPKVELALAPQGIEGPLRGRYAWAPTALKVTAADQGDRNRVRPLPMHALKRWLRIKEFAH